MTNNKIFEAVVWAKELITELQNEGINFGDTPIETANWIIKTTKHLPGIKIVDVVAVATVLSSGTWVEDLRWGWTFMTPTTKDAISNFKVTKKWLNKHKKLVNKDLFVIPAKEVV